MCYELQKIQNCLLLLNFVWRDPPLETGNRNGKTNLVSIIPETSISPLNSHHMACCHLQTVDFCACPFVDNMSFQISDIDQLALLHG